MIDLHTHSTASDGTDSPAQLVRAAAVAGLSTIALSDHDTTRGWQEAERAVNDLPPGFTLVPAAEFSCVLHDRAGRRIGLHLLGYLFDPSHDALKSERARLRDSRLGRGEAIVGNLVGAGYPISWQRVVELAQGGSVGRPHIAQALIEQDVVSSVSEAFTDLLSNRSR